MMSEPKITNVIRTMDNVGVGLVLADANVMSVKPISGETRMSNVIVANAIDPVQRLINAIVPLGSVFAYEALVATSATNVPAAIWATRHIAKNVVSASTIGI